MDINETDLISFFESIPLKLDDEKKIPFYYNYSTFKYMNERNEKVIFSISPSCGEVRLEVEAATIKTKLKLENANQITIQNDTKNLAEIIMITDYMEVYLRIKPTIMIKISEFRNV